MKKRLDLLKKTLKMHNERKGDLMEWFKKHVDTIIVLGGILSSVLYMNSRFNEIDKRFNEIEKEIVMIKTVMIMKGIMPTEMAVQSKDYANL